MKKTGIVFIISLCLLLIAGCNKDVAGNVMDEQSTSREQVIFEDSEKVAECYKDILMRTDTAADLESLELKKEIIACLGKEGYVATDIDNQIDMVNPTLVEAFCKVADSGETGEITIFLIKDSGGFVRYDLYTEGGNVEVEVSSLLWEDYHVKTGYYEKFMSYTWSYSEKGYLFFEQYHMPGFDGPPGQTAIRVKPLDGTCRELNRKYVMPIGYERNKLLITDWSEEDFGTLDFYDFYDIFYLLEYGAYVPYEADYKGTSYEIPKEEFEEVIRTYFKIDSSVLEEKSVYHSDTQTYRYRPRGMYDAEFPYGPYPEVVAYDEQGDGTIKLTVDAVWERKNLDRAFTSELVVRPLEDGSFQYVSNHVLSMPGNIEPSWYQPRLTDEEWEKYYGEME